MSVRIDAISAVVKHGIPTLMSVSVLLMIIGIQMIMNVKLMDAQLVNTGTIGRIHVVAHTVKHGIQHPMVEMVNAKPDAMMMAVKFGTIMPKNASVTLLVKSGTVTMVHASKCAIHPLEKNLTKTPAHAYVEITKHGTAVKVNAHTDVHQVESGMHGMMLVNAH
jgi:hypothetical protein